MSIFCINFCTDVISTNATNSKPPCCRNLTTLFHKTSNREKYDDQNTDYVRVSEH